MSFNFQGLALALALVSFGLIGAMMSGSALFPEAAERYKGMVTNVIIGVILVAASSYLVGALGG